ncbi:MAG: hypothetical protein QNJ36_09070 [Calothrix sp. MO_167.B42]|nr:hypothetical protein [Calothrix sp. MO_167.B42]
MAEEKKTGTDPVGSDGPGGASEVDVTKYATFQTLDTNHQFVAPVAKYKDVADELGIKNVETDKETRKKGIKLKQGTGFIYLSVGLKGGGTLKLVCAFNKLGTALTALIGQKVYGKEVERVRIPRRRVLV